MSREDGHSGPSVAPPGEVRVSARKQWVVLSTLIGGVLLVDYATPWALRESSDWIQAVVLGICIGQLNLIAIWAALGPELGGRGPLHLAGVLEAEDRRPSGTRLARLCRGGHRTRSPGLHCRLACSGGSKIVHDVLHPQCIPMCDGDRRASGPEAAWLAAGAMERARMTIIEAVAAAARCRPAVR